MILHLSVSHSVHTGGSTWAGTPPGSRYTPWGQVPPTPLGRYTSRGRYTSPPYRYTLLGMYTPQAGTPSRAGTPSSRYTSWAGTPPRQAHPSGQIPLLGRYTPLAGTPPPADGYCCGRYASYWNAFLLSFCNDRESIETFTEIPDIRQNSICFVKVFY